MKGASSVIHCAAMKHVIIGEITPEQTVATNVNGAQNVINACIANNVRKSILRVLISS